MGDVDAVRFATQKCPHCGYPCNAASTPDNSPMIYPADGDWSLCIKCASVSVCAVSPLGVITIRAATPEQERQALADPDLVREIERLKRFNAQYRKGS